MADARAERDKIFDHLELLTPNEVERERKIREYSSVDIVFLMDCTGSMAIWMNQVKTKIQEIITSISDHLSPTDPFAGFVGYRDINDKERFLIVPLSQEPWRITDALAATEADGGGDFNEDVLGGLKKCYTDITWGSRTRILIHVFDAPPHGNQYRDAGITHSDDFPDGHPEDEKLTDIFAQFHRLRIDYYAVPVANIGLSRTLKIFDETHTTIIGKQMKTYSITDPTSEFEKVVIKSVQISLTGEDTVCRDVTLNPSQNFAEAVTICVDVYTTKDGRPQHKGREAKIMKDPFGSGSMRWSYFLQFADEAANIYVAKKWKAGRGIVKALCWQQAMCHQETFKIVDALNGKLKNVPGYVPLSCLTIQVIHNAKAGIDAYYTLEKYLPGSYVKHNNNFTFVNKTTEQSHPIFQTIPHFSFVHFASALMVTDLQGVDYTITDPAVHSTTNNKAYGPADLGRVGMKAFFSKHVCNHFCTKHLQLPQAPATILKVQSRYDS